MLLEVAPCFEQITEYSLRWSQRLHEELGEKHVSCLRDTAVRDVFEDYVEEYDPELITFYDHGNEDVLVGNDEKPLLDTGNVGILKGRDMYTMACLSAKRLGADAYRKGCRAYWGYTQPFSFVTTDEEIFSILANMGLILKRKERLSWEECVSRVKDAYNKRIEELGDEGNPWTIIALISDRDCLVCWTDVTQPPSDCTFRNFAVRIMGTPGQKLSKPCVLATIAYYGSWGYGLCTVSRHGASLEGSYLAFALMFLLPLVLLREHVKWLGR